MSREKDQHRVLRTAACNQCGSTFDVRSGWKEQRFCSFQCSVEARRMAMVGINESGIHQFQTDRAAGICVICHLKPAALKTIHCDGCRPPNSARSKNRLVQRSTAGLCWSCENPPRPGRRTCADCAERMTALQRELSIRLKSAAYAVYDNVCACCGFSDVRFLTIDHVNGDGDEERRIIKSVNTIRKHIAEAGVRDPRYQLLCWNCNYARRINSGICFHQAA